MNNQNKALLAGTAYIVATPVGNLEDITLRALRILKEVDFVLCEDTRVTSKLLNKYHIKTKLFAYHKFNEKKQINFILELLKSGKSIAIVSDAGTPLISDPGSVLVCELVKNNISVLPIPGPSALVGALSVYPYPLEEFLFVGFLPNVKSKRERLISSFCNRAENIVLYVAPHDCNKYLGEICSFYPDVKVFYAREITKLYEELWSGNIKDLIEILKNKKIKGEIVLCLHFSKEKNKLKVNVSKDELLENMKKLIEKGNSLKMTSKIIGKELGISSNNLYSLYLNKIKTQNLK